MTSNDTFDPLPEGFVDELLKKLHNATCYHLLNQLFVSCLDPQKENDNRILQIHKNVSLRSQFTSSLPTPPTTTITQSKSSFTPQFQQWIFSNIKLLNWSLWELRGVHYNFALLNDLITYNHLPNLTTIDMLMVWSPSTRPTSSLSTTPHLTLSPDQSFGLSLQSLKYLETLNLKNISFYRQGGVIDQIFPKGAIFPSLKKLSFTQSSLRSQDLRYLALTSSVSFPAVTSFDFSNYHIMSKEDMDYFIQFIEQSLPQLQELNLNSCNISTELAERLFNPPKTKQKHRRFLSNLRSLDLSNNPGIDDEALTLLFTSLQRINEEMNQDPIGMMSSIFSDSMDLQEQQQQYEDDSFKDVGYKLTSLTLDGKQFSPTTLTQTPSLINLKHLSLENCDLTDDHIHHLCKSPYIIKLERLNLQSNPHLTKKAVKSITTSPNMSKLTQLTFPSSQSISSCIPHRISQSSCLIKNLNSIVISNPDPQIKEKNWVKLFSSHNVSALTTLVINRTLLSPLALQSLASSNHLLNLNSLRLDGCVSKIREDREEKADKERKRWTEVLFGNSSLCSRLEVLKLSNCQLDDKDLYHLSQSHYLSNVQSLVLSSNPLITDVGINYLIASPYLMNLAKLDLSENPLLTRKSLEALAESWDLISNVILLRMTGCPLITRKDERLIKSKPYFIGQAHVGSVYLEY